jgi:alanyl-tRNA synthetase
MGAMSATEAEAAGHTAEHLFIRRLQNAGVELSVHSVQQEGFRGKIKLNASRLDWKTVVGAMEETNLRIAAGMQVVEVSFPSLEEARRELPGLRAREERLRGSVRVVLIGDYDAATCAHSHAKSTAEAALFAIEDFHSLTGDSYEISFVTGREAFRRLGAMTLDLVEAARHLHGRHDGIAEASARLEAEAYELKRSLGELTSTLFRELTPSFVVGETQAYVRDLGAVSGKVLLSEVGSATVSGRRLFILGYREEGSPSILIARSPEVNLDCAEALSRVLAEQGGKGGGKKNFAMGGGPTIEVGRAIERLARDARRRLGENP